MGGAISISSINSFVTAATEILPKVVKTGHAIGAAVEGVREGVRALHGGAGSDNTGPPHGTERAPDTLRFQPGSGSQHRIMAWLHDAEQHQDPNQRGETGTRPVTPMSLRSDGTGTRSSVGAPESTIGGHSERAGSIVNLRGGALAASLRRSFYSRSTMNSSNSGSSSSSSSSDPTGSENDFHSAPTHFSNSFDPTDSESVFSRTPSHSSAFSTDSDRSEVFDLSTPEGRDRAAEADAARVALESFNLSKVGRENTLSQKRQALLDQQTKGFARVIDSMGHIS